MTFPPGSPATISLTANLPLLNAGNVTLNASSAGVILDGSIAAPGTAGLMVDSDSNTIAGLEIYNFPSSGIVIGNSSDHNTVEGNIISGNGGPGGLQIFGSDNVVRNTLIGTDAAGSAPMGNDQNGIHVFEASGNQIGPGNTIAHNGGSGLEVEGASATGNTITQNSVFNNAGDGISLTDGGNGELAVPVITDCTETSISGTAPPSCTIDVFSDDSDEGEIYEGATTSDGAGAFVFNKPAGLAGEYITATATDSAGNTSEFSAAASVATQPATWGKVKAEFRD
jgi:parallel beta-helix repeat protein